MHNSTNKHNTGQKANKNTSLICTQLQMMYMPGFTLHVPNQIFIINKMQLGFTRPNKLYWYMPQIILKPNVNTHFLYKKKSKISAIMHTKCFKVLELELAFFLQQFSYFSIILFLMLIIQTASPHAKKLLKLHY